MIRYATKGCAMIKFSFKRAVFASLITIVAGFFACKTIAPSKNGESEMKSVWIPQGGIFVKKGFLIYSSPTGDAVCYGSVAGNQGQVLAQAETNSFKAFLAQLYTQSTGDFSAQSRVEQFYQSYIRGSGRIDITQVNDRAAQILANLSYQAAYQAQSPSNPNACASAGGGGGGGGTPPNQGPSHLFVLLSYGRSFTPGETHTFGFFAKMDPNVKDKIVEHIPFSWLPVISSPADDMNGAPVTDRSGKLQIADVMSALLRPRLGWNFSISKTFEYRKNVLKKNDVTANAAFVITPEQYEYAKSFYNQMNQNTRSAARGMRASSYGYFYQAANEVLFSCPNGRVPTEINCFQTIVAAFKSCQSTGPGSGVAITEFLRGVLQGRGLLGNFYYRDNSQIAPLINQLTPLEADGRFDKPY